ncbi:MAG: hypothetical protein LBP34_06270 [Flavobacteriaceae bacterium]|jgi:tetratricopeptide (TPR) repeat protein|nr:hypothetical protein [Flavobacteriaceae bacterium]
MNFVTKKAGSTFAISAVMLAGMLSAQNIQTGIKHLDNNQFSKAKEIFETLIVQSPTADNYFYLGYYHLKIQNPNIEQASHNFNKGLAADPKSDLNKIGLAAIKLYQKNKAAADADFETIAKNTRYKNATVLYHIARAYTLFPDNPESIDPDKSIEYTQKLLELVKNKDKAEYYIVLGDAYYEKKDPGKAVSNYSRALEIAEDKSVPYALIGNIWGRTHGQGNLAIENFNKAIAENPNYALTYKYLSDFNLRNQKYDESSKNLQKYIALTGNNDSETQFDLARIAYYAKDYNKSLEGLNKSWNGISNPLKHKLKALVLIERSEFAEAHKNINQYFQILPESKRESSDYGILGKIQSSLVSTVEGEEEKERLKKEAIANLTKAHAAGDQTYDYYTLLLSLNPSSSASLTSATNPKIEALKKAIAANQNDTTSWYNLALEQYEIKDYLGSIASWDKLISLIPSWETAYAGKAMALYANDTTDQNGLVAQTYQKYIDMVEAKKEYSANEKMYLTIAYTFFAYKDFHTGNKEKAQEYVNKTLAIDLQNADALNLQKLLLQ